MKSYILLRNNRESGPYTLKELKTVGITESDLVWVEGESTCWSHPSVFNELKDAARTGIKIPLADASENRSSSFSSGHSATEYAGTNTLTDDPSLFRHKKETSFPLYNRQRRRNWQQLSSGFFGMGVLLVGVMLCAFVVKKLVDQFEYQPHIASAQAIEIAKETLPVSRSANAAKASPTPLTVPGNTVQTTVETERRETPQSVIAKKAEEKKESTVMQETPQAVNAVIEPPVEKESPVVNAEIVSKTVEEKSEPVAVKKAPSLSISANDYKVGVFGGISELELSINNPSNVAVNKATVEVEFLKPNGSVIKSQTLSVENISPGGIKKLTVPSSNRGVKVRYRIVSVNAQEGKIAANDI